jgi:hypothetical protein
MVPIRRSMAALQKAMVATRWRVDHRAMG